MPDPHCSKCCPVKPPTPAPPFVPPTGVYLWILGGSAAMVGAWALVLWIGHTMWP